MEASSQCETPLATKQDVLVHHLAKPGLEDSMQRKTPQSMGQDMQGHHASECKTPKVHGCKMMKCPRKSSQLTLDNR